MTLNRPRSRSQNFRIKYLEYHERYNVRHIGGQIGKHLELAYFKIIRIARQILRK